MNPKDLSSFSFQSGIEQVDEHILHLGPPERVTEVRSHSSSEIRGNPNIQAAVRIVESHVNHMVTRERILAAIKPYWELPTRSRGCVWFYPGLAPPSTAFSDLTRGRNADSPVVIWLGVVRGAKVHLFLSETLTPAPASHRVGVSCSSVECGASCRTDYTAAVAFASSQSTSLMACTNDSCAGGGTLFSRR